MTWLIFSSKEIWRGLHQQSVIHFSPHQRYKSRYVVICSPIDDFFRYVLWPDQHIPYPLLVSCHRLHTPVCVSSSVDWSQNFWRTINLKKEIPSNAFFKFATSFLDISFPLFLQVDCKWARQKATILSHKNLWEFLISEDEDSRFGIPNPFPWFMILRMK